MIAYPPDKVMFECSYPEWQEKRESTTFWSDFTIADAYGEKGIKDTFKRAFGEWKSNYKYLTELVMVLNHKMWQHYEDDNKDMTSLYQNLYDEAAKYGEDNLKDDELKFFLYVLD